MRYWKVRLREILYDEDYTDTFERWELQIQETIPESASRFERPARKDYHELLAHYDADENPGTKSESRRKARIVNRTIASEASRRIYGAIRQIVNPSEYTPLARIQVPRKAGDIVSMQLGNVPLVLKDTSPENIIWDTVISQKDIELTS